MHHRALQFRLCYNPRLVHFPKLHHARLVSDVRIISSNSEGIPVTESPERWSVKRTEQLGRIQEDTKDVFVDDLPATLEAHRARNRAAIIRRVGATSIDATSIPYKRPLQKGSGGETRTVPDHSEDRSSLPVRPSAPADCKSSLADGPTEAQEAAEGQNANGMFRVSVPTGRKYKAEHVRMWPADSVQAKQRYGKTDGTTYVKKDDVLEYSGKAQWPNNGWRINHQTLQKEFQRPWLTYIEDTKGRHFDRLSDEIKAYEAYMRLTPIEEAASQLVVSDLTSIIQSKPNMNPLTMLGSRSTGLATPLSDFDFTISLPSSGKEDTACKEQQSKKDVTKDTLNRLRKFQRLFQSSKKLCNVEFIHARVPIVKTRHLATGLDIQIQTRAPYQLAQEYTAAYLAEFPSLRPLYVIIRQSLEIRGLTTVFEGGLGSYSIFMMIATALKHESGKFAANDLAGRLLHVLNFYGNADLYKHGFSSNPPRVFDKHREHPPLAEREAGFLDSQLRGIDLMTTPNIRKPYLLCLQDPANDTNDLGKNAYAIKHVQATFNAARDHILKALERQGAKSDEDKKGGTWSCLDYLVRADYRAFEEHRSKIERSANPLVFQKDKDYTISRIKQDILNRAKDYKGRKEEDEYGVGSPSAEGLGMFGVGRVIRSHGGRGSQIRLHGQGANFHYRNRSVPDVEVG